MSNKRSGSALLIIIIGIVLVAATAGLVYRYVSNPSSPETGQAPSPAPPPLVQNPEVSAPGAASLGNQILEGAQNPIKDKVPSSDPAGNPIENVYKNPF